ncbi:N(G):N(G)-dimethylarginine dimethylaminohydrolase 1-like protein [Dinothrombium tinctorium]|uniref:N(G):N(G)-dimethylarginine dimethylaminohydrolase 1-like protein n=1 Tax=Dinothrombium tinctorium TaxID=1965070 RepID=A0A3S3PDQ6_9ACAR|nr:N(G):N(G)-dimethylarginine dimethylaminohydrolase 1-like protein [Dinothrombium tinctorium]
MSNYGRYTHAIVSRIPNSFVNALNSSEVIDINEAKSEHLEYTKLLRSLGLDVIELPADESLPDSPFVEDTAVVCNGIALICRPGHHSRAKEVRV